MSERSLLLAYYIAASTTFEPEKSSERLAWAITTILVEIIASQKLSDEQKREFVDEFVKGSIVNNQNGGRWEHVSQLISNRCISKLSRMLSNERKCPYLHMYINYQT